MTLRERLEWLGRMTLLVFILASAAFLSAITAMRIAIHGREVTMPNLVGKNVSEASQMLQSRGLVLRVADRIYSDQPINVVVRQTPTAGLLMKVSQQAHVVLSLGQRQLQIPLLEGNSLRASRIELLRAGLQVGEVSGVTMTEQPVDAVVVQNPKPGAGAATPPGIQSNTITIFRPQCSYFEPTSGYSALSGVAPQDTYWDLQISAQDSFIGATTEVHQGIEIRQPAGNCP